MYKDYILESINYNDFSIGDKVIISGHYRTDFYFENEIAEIAEIDKYSFSFEFQKSIIEISNGKYNGHGNSGKNKMGHCWNFIKRYITKMEHYEQEYIGDMEEWED